MISESFLFNVQLLCCSISGLLALMLFFSRVHQRNTYVGYETSRWMLISSMVLLSIHFWMQMHYGFRARSEEEGALINILFYSPVEYLIVFATIRMACGRQHLRNYLIVSGVGMSLILTCFLVGWFYYGSLYMPLALKAMGIIYFLSVVIVIVMTWKEIARVRKKVEDETASDISNYDLYMHVGTMFLYATGVIITLCIFSSVAIIYFVAPIFLLVIIFYIVCFMALGFNISSVSEILEEATEDESEEAGAESKADEKKEETIRASLTPEQVEIISAAIGEWRRQRGFSVMSLNSSTLADRIGISRKLLGLYLTEHEGKSFRVWLSDIRIEEVKLMLLDKTEYSNEAIASECGFSSRSWMQEKFKATTGLTPNEWREAHLKTDKK